MRVFGTGSRLRWPTSGLVDNAIAADAQNVNEFFPPQRNAYLAIQDDDDGMAPSELVAAIRYSSRSSLDPRAERDLGQRLSEGSINDEGIRERVDVATGLGLAVHTVRALIAKAQVLGSSWMFIQIG
jgi:hypothetical protein